jgi:3'-phosphoadenosine 5'-phosphosulfate sulfotransferase (PAPS reductase)/FAD synthetase
MIYVLSVSAGKDSTAGLLWAKRIGLAPRLLVSCDTGWEAEFEGASWSGYLADVQERTGETIKIVSAPVQFADRVLAHDTFPGRLNRRWCTQELKLDPFRVELDRIREETGDDVTVLVFVRAEESNGKGDETDRALMPEREWSDFYDCWVWRPLLKWTLAEVIAEHQHANVPLNPLYHLGAERVGCWPCIKAGKREIRLVSELDPGRIEKIRQLESATGTTMFCLERSRKRIPGQPAPERKLLPTPIDEMVAWSKTKRGGLKLAVIAEPSGCARWGICEAPLSLRNEEE